MRDAEVAHHQVTFEHWEAIFQSGSSDLFFIFYLLHLYAAHLSNVHHTMIIENFSKRYVSPVKGMVRCHRQVKASDIFKSIQMSNF